MRVIQRRLVPAILAVTLPAVVRADDQPEVMDILKKADAATRAVQAVSYRAEFSADGDWAKACCRASGKVTVKKPAASFFGIRLRPGSGSARIEGTTPAADGSGTVPFDCGMHGGEVFVIDPGQRVFLHGRLPIPRIPYLPALRLLMREYVVPRPFGDEIAGKLARREGVKDIGGVACDVVYILYQDGSESRWYFGQEDHLPRRVERLSTKGNLFLTLTDLDTKPEITAATFAPQCPEGYEDRQRVLTTIDPQILRDYVGTYRINQAEARTVMVKGRRIFTQRTDNPKLELFPVSETQFFYADSFTSLTFFRDQDGKVTHQVLDRLYGDLETAVKITPPPRK